MAERRARRTQTPATVPIPTNPGFWEQDPGRVAGALIGMRMQVGAVDAVILDADGYRRAENEANGLYTPILEALPGSVYCPKRRNAVLFLFATHDRGAPGGCVLIRAAEIDGSVYDGPGKLTERLGITIHGTAGSMQWLDSGSMAITLDTPLVPVQPSTLSRTKIAGQQDGNGIGMETLQKLMPQIAQAYLRTKPGKPFEEFVNGLLTECPNARALRRTLTAMRK